MSECLAESDVRELAKATLSEFDLHVASLSPDLCAPSNQAAMRLEAELLTIEGAGHGFKDKDAETADRAMFEFFEKHLKKR